MKLVRPVLFSFLVSLLVASGSSSSPGGGGPQPNEVEPGGPLGASVTLLRVDDQGGALRALVRLELNSTTDADATVTPLLAAQSQGSQRRSAGRQVTAALEKGRPVAMLLEGELDRGVENHLFFDVRAKGHDGSLTGTTLYLRVNLDPSLEPTEVNGALEYQGAQAPEVKP